MRVAFALSVIRCKDSELIVMDEWLSVGDSEFRHFADKILRKIISKNVAIIIATNSNPDRFLFINKHIKLMGNGNINISQV